MPPGQLMVRGFFNGHPVMRNVALPGDVATEPTCHRVFLRELAAHHVAGHRRISRPRLGR